MGTHMAGAFSTTTAIEPVIAIALRRPDRPCFPNSESRNFNRLLLISVRLARTRVSPPGWRSPFVPMSRSRRHSGTRGGEELSRAPAPLLRRVRPRADVLAHRHHPDAVLLAAMRDFVHRGIAVAQGPRPRPRHGRSGVQLGGLDPSRLSAGRCPYVA